MCLAKNKQLVYKQDAQAHAVNKNTSQMGLHSAVKTLPASSSYKALLEVQAFLKRKLSIRKQNIVISSHYKALSIVTFSH